MNSVKTFEQSFACHFNESNAFAFWKGRVAMYAILKACGVKEGDEIILPGYTCVMDVNPIKYLGAKPVYVDIEPDTFNMNPALLEGKITPRTRVIVAQHTYGYQCDMDAIMDIAAKNGITVIEDCCLAFGSTYKGKIAGTFGRAAYFSFQWNKPFTTGLGGMAITNEAGLAEKIKGLCDSDMCMPSPKEVIMLAAQLAVYRMLIYPRTTALAQDIFRYLTRKGAVVGSSSAAEFNPQMAADFFKGMSCVQARSGLRQLAKVENNIAHRRQMAELYDKLLTEKGWPTRKYDKSIMDPVMVRYPVRVKDKAKALEQATAAGVELGSWFECPLHPVETPLERYDYIPGMCPVAEKASKETVNLPLHPRVSEKTIRRTVEFISRFHPA
ncbi:MAG: DegT/DnrJ/EryC1/StrS family aminotransferase [Sedimentisphaerales bacterium]|jgi:dTDP-4-amino-4,6-dideoxygalactose transaminase